jgi:hypothetical protein
VENDADLGTYLVCGQIVKAGNGFTERATSLSDEIVDIGNVGMKWHTKPQPGMRNATDSSGECGVRESSTIA